MLTILFDGVAYGMLLFILAVGLSVTMGLMNFINLAHGAFAMLGGYLTVVLSQRYGVPFLLCLPVSFLVTALVGAVCERTLYRPMYGKAHLDQVLFTIGLAFMAVAVTDYWMGSQQQIMQLPDWLRGRTELFEDTPWRLGMGHYRLFIIAVCGLLTLALQYVLSATRFGSQLRASVDDARVAAGLGIRVNLVFAVTFAVGSGLAGLGGALGADLEGDRGVIQGGAQGAGDGLDLGDAVGVEHRFGHAFEQDHVGRVAQIVVGLDHQQLRIEPGFREVTFGGRVADIRRSAVGEVLADVVTRFVAG